MNQTVAEFTEFWKEHEKKLWRLQLRAFYGFYSMSKGAFEDSFEDGQIEIWKSWGKFYGYSRYSWAIGVMKNVINYGYRKYKIEHKIIVIYEPSGGENDEEYLANNLENIGDKKIKSMSPDDFERQYQELVDSIDGFTEKCAEQFTKNKRAPFTSSVENVLYVFYKRIKDNLTGAEITELTRKIEEPGMAESQQTQVLQWMKKCIARRAILTGFDDVINER